MYIQPGQSQEDYTLIACQLRDVPKTVTDMKYLIWVASTQFLTLVQNHQSCFLLSSIQIQADQNSQVSCSPIPG